MKEQAERIADAMHIGSYILKPIESYKVYGHNGLRAVIDIDGDLARVTTDHFTNWMPVDKMIELLEDEYGSENESQEDNV